MKRLIALPGTIGGKETNADELCSQYVCYLAEGAPVGMRTADTYQPDVRYCSLVVGIFLYVR